MTAQSYLRRKWIYFAIACLWQIGFATWFFILMSSDASGKFWKLLLVYLAWSLPIGIFICRKFHYKILGVLDADDKRYNDEGHMRYETQTTTNSYVDWNGDIVITEQETGQWVHDTQNLLGKFMLLYALLFPLIFIVDGIVIFIRLVCESRRLKKLRNQNTKK